MTREQIDAENKAITALKAKLAPYVPQGWEQCECMTVALDKNLTHSPLMVMIEPSRELKGTYKRFVERKEAFSPMAMQIASKLNEAGFRTSRDGYVIYVRS